MTPDEMRETLKSWGVDVMRAKRVSIIPPLYSPVEIEVEYYAHNAQGKKHVDPHSGRVLTEIVRIKTP